MGLVLTMSEPAIDKMLYGDRSNFLATYLQNQLQNIGPAFNAMSERIHGALSNSYNFVTDKLVQYGIRNELSSAGVNYLDNYYNELLTWQALQEANPTMQRWVMSHPEVRQLYVDQNLDGYSDTYTNVFGKGVGKEDYNYRRATNGVIGDDGYTLYFEDLLHGDRELDHYEKDIIQNTFSAISWVLNNTEFDFTNKSEQATKINVNYPYLRKGLVKGSQLPQQD